MALLAVLALTLCAASCGPSDPHTKALYEGLDYAETLVGMQRMREGAKAVDPELEPSVLIGYIFGAGTHSTNPPPEGVGFVQEGPPRAWCVVFKSDDANRQVILEAYGEKTDSPLKSTRITVDKP